MIMGISWIFLLPTVFHETLDLPTWRQSHVTMRCICHLLCIAVTWIFTWFLRICYLTVGRILMNVKPSIERTHFVTFCRRVMLKLSSMTNVYQAIKLLTCNNDCGHLPTGVNILAHVQEVLRCWNTVKAVKAFLPAQALQAILRPAIRILFVEYYLI